ncbi:MAG: hypothetical protein WBB28_20350 [Crinalium sp.]
MQVNFLDYECEVKVSKYNDGNTRLQLVSDIGMPVATATVIAPVSLPANQVVIKNYSENEGILEALVNAGIVKPTGQTVPVGRTIGHICNLLLSKES